MGARRAALLQEQSGQRAAFDAALEIVRGDVDLFLDADDELKPGTASAVARAFDADDGTARVGSGSRSSTRPAAPPVRPSRPPTWAGTLVAVARARHASVMTVPAAWATPVPDGVRVQDAALGYLAIISGYGVRRAGAIAGEPLCVVGAGPISALAQRLAQLHGPGPVTVVAASRHREAAALHAGRRPLCDRRAGDRHQGGGRHRGDRRPRRSGDRGRRRATRRDRRAAGLAARRDARRGTG